MNFGFNSNVRVGDVLYHVQTEDRGPSHPFLDTVVYLAGRVVHKRSTSYHELGSAPVDADDLAQDLHQRIVRQHREVMAELEAGTLQIAGDEGPKKESALPVSHEGLEIVLLNPKSWLVSGNATLEVELRRRGSAEEIAGAEIETLLELEKDRSTLARGNADAHGRATLSFPLPATVKDGTALVIRARDRDLYGELRFRLKARRPDTVPTPPSK